MDRNRTRRILDQKRGYFRKFLLLKGCTQQRRSSPETEIGRRLNLYGMVGTSIKKYLIQQEARASLPFLSDPVVEIRSRSEIFQLARFSINLPDFRLNSPDDRPRSP